MAQATLEFFSWKRKEQRQSPVLNRPLLIWSLISRTFFISQDCYSSYNYILVQVFITEGLSLTLATDVTKSQGTIELVWEESHYKLLRSCHFSLRETVTFIELPYCSLGENPRVQHAESWGNLTCHCRAFPALLPISRMVSKEFLVGLSRNVYYPLYVHRQFSLSS